MLNDCMIIIYILILISKPHSKSVTKPKFPQVVGNSITSLSHWTHLSSKSKRIGFRSHLYALWCHYSMGPECGKFLGLLTVGIAFWNKHGPSAAMSYKLGLNIQMKNKIKHLCTHKDSTIPSVTKCESDWWGLRTVYALDGSAGPESHVHASLFEHQCWKEVLLSVSCWGFQCYQSLSHHSSVD